MHPDVEQLAQDYLAEVIRGEAGDTEAFDRFARLLDTSTETAWTVILRLLELTTTDHDVAIVGTGPLEDILVRYPGVFVSRAVEEASHNSRFRRALDFVTIGDGEIPLELFKRLAAARGEITYRM
jgi:hypothetical protein